MAIDIKGNFYSHPFPFKVLTSCITLLLHPRPDREQAQRANTVDLGDVAPSNSLLYLHLSVLVPKQHIQPMHESAKVYVCSTTMWISAN